MSEVKKMHGEVKKMYVVTVNDGGGDNIDFVFDSMCEVSTFAGICLDHIVHTDSEYYKDREVKVTIKVKDVAVEFTEETTEETEEAEE